MIEVGKVPTLTVLAGRGILKKKKRRKKRNLQSKPGRELFQRRPRDLLWEIGQEGLL